MTYIKEQKISREELPELLRELSHSGAKPISILLNTEKKLLKKDRFSGTPNNIGEKINKLSYIQAILNFDYQNSVNKQREREGEEKDFKSKSNWFSHKVENPRALLEANGEKYLQLKVEKVLETHYFLLDNDEEIAYNEIENLLPAKNKAQNQGVEKQIITIAPKLESILQFTVNGVLYKVS